MRLPPLGIEGLHRRLCVAHGNRRRVAVAPIQNQLHRCGFARMQLLPKARADVQHQHHALVGDGVSNRVGIGEILGTHKGATALEASHQRCGLGTAAFVQQGVVGAGDVVSGHVAEQQRLHDHRHEQQQPAARVLHDGQQFLAAEVQQGQDPVAHGQPLSCLRVWRKASNRNSVA